MDLIWGKREAISFFRGDWTGRIALIPKENFFSTRIPGLRQVAHPGMTAVMLKRRRPDCASLHRCGHGALSADLAGASATVPGT